MRAGIMLVIGAMPVPPSLSGIPMALAALLLVLSCYFGLGLGLAGMILVFGPSARSDGLLGGSAARESITHHGSLLDSHLSVVVPLTSGLG
jgi:hypothetical protein